MKLNEHYQYLIGKDKKEVKRELGQEYNFYPSIIWTYQIKTNWLGIKTFLVVYFQENNVKKILIKKCYGKKIKP